MKTIDPTTQEELDEIASNLLNILQVPKFEFQGLLSKFYIFFNTVPGQLVMDNGFGINLCEYMFELKTQDKDSIDKNVFEIMLSQDISNKTKSYFSDFNLLNIESFFENEFQNKNPVLILKGLWNYKSKFSFETISVIKTHKFSTTISNLKLYQNSNDDENINEDNLLEKVSKENEKLFNIINKLLLQLKEKEDKE